MKIQYAVVFVLVMGLTFIGWAGWGASAVEHFCTDTLRAQPSLPLQPEDPLGPADVGTQHSGTLTHSETWAYADEPHYIIGDLTVPVGVTLTIEAGVNVPVSHGCSVNVEGHLIASGTEGKPIFFASSEQEKNPDDWGGIGFSGVSGNRGTGHLRFVTVSHARNQSLPCAICITNVNDAEHEVVLEYVTVQNNADHGVLVSDSRTNLVNCTVSNNGNTIDDAGLFVVSHGPWSTDPSLGADVQQSTFNDNYGYGIYTTGGARLVLRAANELRGNGNYPMRTESHNLPDVLNGGNDFDAGYMLIGDYDQSGDTEWMIGSDVIFNNDNNLWGYELEKTVTVGPTATLTIEDNLQILGRSEAALKVLGHLDVVGTHENGVLFSAENQTPGGWYGLHFFGLGALGSGHLRYATVRYGRDRSQPCNLCLHTVMDGEVVIEDSVISGGLDHGIQVHKSRMVLRDTVVTDNGSAHGYPALAIGGGSVVTVTRATIEDNSGAGIAVDGDSTALRMNGDSISENGGDGLRVLYGGPTLAVTNTRIFSNTEDGLDYEGTTTPVIRFSQFWGNGELGIHNRNTSVCLDARYNYWGDVAGPDDASAADDGCMGAFSNSSLGEGVSDDVNYLPWAGDSPTVTVVSEGVGVEAVFTDAQGMTTTLALPAGSVTETTILVYTVVPYPTQPFSSELAFAGHAFDITTYTGGPEIGTLAKPVTVNVDYGDSLAGVDVDSVRLYYWTGEIWRDAATTCSPVSSYVNAAGYVRVPICHLSEFALLGTPKSGQPIYLPLVIRN